MCAYSDEILIKPVISYYVRVSPGLSILIVKVYNTSIHFVHDSITYIHSYLQVNDLNVGRFQIKEREIISNA